jgi:tetratricopeptide (TPR) repeat protein
VCVYERHAPFGEEQESVYGVSWRCPDGHGRSLDVCPVGPLVPTRELCLNCGGRYESDAADVKCGACGLSRRNCPAALGIEQSPASDPLASASESFRQGLFRRGLAVLNLVLRDRAAFPEAWLLKAQFLNSVGFNRSAAEMIGDALAFHEPGPARGQLLEERSFLWAECGRGEEALADADAALALLPASVRANYLRGRALALVGRLEEARDEMTRVLTLDPGNTDAVRGKGMIDEALWPQGHRPWWQFWRRKPPPRV